MPLNAPGWSSSSCFFCSCCCCFFSSTIQLTTMQTNFRPKNGAFFFLCFAHHRDCPDDFRKMKVPLNRAHSKILIKGVVGGFQKNNFYPRLRLGQTRRNYREDLFFSLWIKFRVSHYFSSDRGGRALCSVKLLSHCFAIFRALIGLEIAISGENYNPPELFAPPRSLLSSLARLTIFTPTT